MKSRGMGNNAASGFNVASGSGFSSVVTLKCDPVIPTQMRWKGLILENTKELKEKLQRAESSGMYWSSLSGSIIRDLYEVRNHMNRGENDIARVQIDFMLSSVVIEGEQRTICQELAEGLVAFHALPREAKVVSK